MQSRARFFLRSDLNPTGIDGGAVGFDGELAHKAKHADNNIKDKVLNQNEGVLRVFFNSSKLCLIEGIIHNLRMPSD